MNKLIFLVVVVLILNPLRLFGQENEVKNLIYMCEDVPPSNYLDNGVLKGFSIELLKLLWKKMNIPEQQIKVVPWSRGYELLLSEKDTVLFSMTRTKEREKLFKWVGPIFTVKNVFLGLAGKNFKISSLDDVKKYKIGAIRDDVLEQKLLSSGFKRENIESVATLKQNFDKLNLGRIDLITHTKSTLNEFIKLENENPDKYKIYFVIGEQKNYYAFNNNISDDVIRLFQNALDGLKNEHKELLIKYNLDL
jgi:polar amino acid transport system substrate-binding protein